MADTPPSPQQPSPQLEAGAYEVIRQRLTKHGAELQRRLDSLNNARQAVFAWLQTALVTTKPLTPEYTAMPHDKADPGGPTCNV